MWSKFLKASAKLEIKFRDFLFIDIIDELSPLMLRHFYVPTSLYRIFRFSQRNMLFSFVLFPVPSVNQSEEDVISLVKQSLKNLQTDYIDL